MPKFILVQESIFKNFSYRIIWIEGALVFYPWTFYVAFKWHRGKKFRDGIPVTGFDLYRKEMKRRWLMRWRRRDAVSWPHLGNSSYLRHWPYSTLYYTIQVAIHWPCSTLLHNTGKVTIPLTLLHYKKQCPCSSLFSKLVFGLLSAHRRTFTSFSTLTSILYVQYLSNNVLYTESSLTWTIRQGARKLLDTVPVFYYPL
jgi:hypothetical protein